MYIVQLSAMQLICSIYVSFTFDTELELHHPRCKVDSRCLFNVIKSWVLRINDQKIEQIVAWRSAIPWLQNNRFVLLSLISSFVCICACVCSTHSFNRAISYRYSCRINKQLTIQTTNIHYEYVCVCVQYIERCAFNLAYI